jgi:hypothetical protein
MTASYATRLVLQSLSAFFLIHLVASLLIAALSPALVRMADRLRPCSGATLLLFVRLLPLALAVYATTAIAIPSYLHLEPEVGSERIGIRVVCLAIGALALFIRPALRTFTALRSWFNFERHLERRSHITNLSAAEVWLSRETTPRVAVTGFLKSRVFLSQGTLALFSPSELELVLNHESAHQRSRDNLKRLMWLMLPDGLPFVDLAAALQRAHKRLIEWAADDFAVSGDPHRSVCLASALVAFARSQNEACCCALTTSLVRDTADLTRRVERLLAPAESPLRLSRGIGTFVAIAAVLAFACTVPLSDLPGVHRALELLSH